jgi:hypothetical protein
VSGVISALVLSSLPTLVLSSLNEGSWNESLTSISGNSIPEPIGAWFRATSDLNKSIATLSTSVRRQTIPYSIHETATTKTSDRLVLQPINSNAAESISVLDLTAMPPTTTTPEPEYGNPYTDTADIEELFRDILSQFGILRPTVHPKPTPCWCSVSFLCFPASLRGTSIAVMAYMWINSVTDFCIVA